MAVVDKVEGRGRAASRFVEERGAPCFEALEQHGRLCQVVHHAVDAERTEAARETLPHGDFRSDEESLVVNLLLNTFEHFERKPAATFPGAPVLPIAVVVWTQKLRP